MSSKQFKKSVLAMLVLSGMAAGPAFAQVAGAVYDAKNDINQQVQIYNQNAQIGNQLLQLGEERVQTDTGIVNATFNGLDLLVHLKHMLVNELNLGVNTVSMLALTTRKEGNMLDVTTNNYEITKKNYEITEKNYDIDKTFTWITNNYYGGDGGDCPIGSAPDECDGTIGLVNLAGKIGKDAGTYSGTIASADNLINVGFDASSSRKQANDALVNTLNVQKNALKDQAGGLTHLIEGSMQAQGHGKQLQYANALAGAQAVQMAEMRSLMLASENARAAAAQAAADKESRQAASRQNLRRNLGGASASATAMSTPKY